MVKVFIGMCVAFIACVECQVNVIIRLLGLTKIRFKDICIYGIGMAF